MPSVCTAIATLQVEVPQLKKMRGTGGARTFLCFVMWEASGLSPRSSDRAPVPASASTAARAPAGEGSTA